MDRDMMALIDQITQWQALDLKFVSHQIVK